MYNIIIHNYGCYDVFYKYWSMLENLNDPLKMAM
jgi:hypothetical protein